MFNVNIECHVQFLRKYSYKEKYKVECKIQTASHSHRKKLNKKPDKEKVDTD